MLFIFWIKVLTMTLSSKWSTNMTLKYTVTDIKKIKTIMQMKNFLIRIKHFESLISIFLKSWSKCCATVGAASSIVGNQFICEDLFISYIWSFAITSSDSLCLQIVCMEWSQTIISNFAAFLRGYKMCATACSVNQNLEPAFISNCIYISIYIYICFVFVN